VHSRRRRLRVSTVSRPIGKMMVRRRGGNNVFRYDRRRVRRGGTFGFRRARCEPDYWPVPDGREGATARIT